MIRNKNYTSIKDSYSSSSSPYDLTHLHTLRSIRKKNKLIEIEEYRSVVDEAPEFHDPYSDLSLFLSDSIKKEMMKISPDTKWSHKIEELLLKKISLEFQKKFPKYRLSSHAIKKTWDKINFYSQQIQTKKESINQDGKINIHFFIKENLKQYDQTHNSYYPHHFSYQLATKLAECIATVDGTRPKLDELTQTIWSMQRHLLTDYPSSLYKSPYEKQDQIDNLIIKTQLEILAKELQIGQGELEYKIKESLQSLHDLPSFSSLDTVTCNVSAMLAEKLYPSSPFHLQFVAEQKSAICNFMRRHTSLCKSASAAPQLTDVVRRVLALYSLASQLPKDIPTHQLKEAILATYPTPKPEKPPLPQAVYAFISAELLLMRNDQFCHSIDYVAKALCASYEETKNLPSLPGNEKEILEIVLWKILVETEGVLEKLPYRIGQKIEEEIGLILIDNPHLSFSAIVQEVVQFFRNTKELTETKKWKEIDRRVHLHSLQNDLLCRIVSLDADLPLTKLLQKKWKEKQGIIQSHFTFIAEVAQDYLKSYPHLSVYAVQLQSRIWTVYKYLWYQEFSKQESSFERFIQWHTLFFSQNNYDPDTLCMKLDELCTKCTPLLSPKGKLPNRR